MKGCSRKNVEKILDKIVVNVVTVLTHCFKYYFCWNIYLECKKEGLTVESIFVQLSNKLEVQVPTPMETLLPLALNARSFWYGFFLGRNHEPSFLGFPLETGNG